MDRTYLKQADRPLNETEPAVREQVADLLRRLESEREPAAQAMALAVSYTHLTLPTIYSV